MYSSGRFDQLSCNKIAIEWRRKWSVLGTRRRPAISEEYKEIDINDEVEIDEEQSVGKVDTGEHQINILDDQRSHRRYVRQRRPLGHHLELLLTILRHSLIGKAVLKRERHFELYLQDQVQLQGAEFFPKRKR
jgi:IS4 transposase